MPRTKKVAFELSLDIAPILSIIDAENTSEIPPSANENGFVAKYLQGLAKQVDWLQRGDKNFRKVTEQPAYWQDTATYHYGIAVEEGRADLLDEDEKFQHAKRQYNAAVKFVEVTEQFEADIHRLYKEFTGRDMDISGSAKPKRTEHAAAVAELLG
jgi:hypothetical protein